MPPRPSPCLLLLAALSPAADWSPPAPEAARQAVAGLVMQAVARAPLRVGLTLSGPAADATVTAADAQRVTISQGGAVVPMPWARLSLAQCAAIGLAAAGDRPADRLLVVDLCLAGGDTVRGGELLREAGEGPAATARLAWLRARQPAAEEVEPAEAAGPRRRLEPAAALRWAVDVTPVGFDRRLGPAWSKGAGGGPFPRVWVAPERTAPKQGPIYQWGSYTAEAGDYSSNQGQVCYAGAGLGIDRVQVIQMDHNCFTEKPCPPWWGGFRPEPHSQGWARAAGGGPPLWAARGATSWSNCGVFLFANGVLATAGTCTAFGSDPVVRLPPGKVPTALCVLPRNELALVTVCDSKTMKGQLAVVALTGCKPGFAHEWQQPHPGLPSVAMLAGMKVLGFVDLPGIAVPTAVSAIGDASPGRLSAKSGHIGTFKDMDLADAGIRQQFRDGNNGDYCNRAGWAVVAALHEDRVAFVDLQPLFQRYREMYFGSAADYQRTRDQGPGPKQWPTTFEAEPAQQPVAVRTVEVAEPCAVFAGRGGRAWIASRDGSLAIWAVGGLADAGPADPAAIVERERLRIGRNPCALVPHRWNGDTVIAVCRAEREIQFLRTANGSTGIVRRIRDANLLDPVHCEIVETHGIQAEILLVADFKGRKIANYRLGELVFATQGGARFPLGPDGKAEIECGGVLELPGNPYVVTSTNVN